MSEDTVGKEFDRLRGRLCGLIESWGLDEKQERGAIQTLKSLSYDAEGIVKDMIAEKDDRINLLEIFIENEIPAEKTP